MRPRCYNRAPFRGLWMRAGYRNGKILLKWVPHLMSQDCKSYSVPAGTIPVPVREKWVCDGCVLFTDAMKKLTAGE